MRIAVSNSSPLIFLAKTGDLDIIAYFYDIINIPPAVYHEVIVKGLANGCTDAILVKNFIDAKKIVVNPNFSHVVQSKGISTHSIHPGEVDAIDLALTFHGSAILLDDEEARKIARALNIVVKGTLGLLIDYNKAGQIDKNKALKKLDELNKIMYLSADVYHLVENSFI